MISVQGDKVYEIEMNERFYFYQKIHDNGIKPHYETAVVKKNVVDLMTKTKKKTKQQDLDEDALPFYEVYISRKKTVRDLLDIVCTSLMDNPKCSRLWIGN